MKILYLGAEAGWTTSRHRADALVRLGHDVTIIDTEKFLPCGQIGRKVAFRLGRLFSFDYLDTIVMRRLKKLCSEVNYDFLWVNQQHLVPSSFLKWWCSLGKPSAVYINDNPFSGNDKRLWETFMKALPYYSLVAVMRKEDAEIAKKMGCNNVVRTWMSYDEVVHQRLPYDENDSQKWSSDVLFIGTYMPERGPFMSELIRQGVPLSIYGNGWQSYENYDVISEHWKGGAITGQDYVKAIQYSKIMLGLLSVDNKDEHTQRTMEVPYVGSLLCCQRTSEHKELYIEGVEAVMWQDAYECATLCKELLSNPEQIRRIAAAGHQKVISNEVSNMETMRKLLALVRG